MMSRFWPGMAGGGIIAHIIAAVLALAIIALLTLTVILLVRSIRASARAQAEAARQCAAPPKTDIDPLKILGERFAKGEIGEEEYKRKKEMLQNP